MPKAPVHKGTGGICHKAEVRLAIATKSATTHTFVDAAGSTEFDEFVGTCKELSLYDTGITPKYGDKMITLSTCEYSQTNGRLVVVARRVQ